jgi:hypothetical protein
MVGLSAGYMLRTQTCMHGTTVDRTYCFARCCILPCKLVCCCAGARECPQECPHRVRPPALQLPAPQAHRQRLPGLEQQQHATTAHAHRHRRHCCVCCCPLHWVEAWVCCAADAGCQLGVGHTRLQTLVATHNSTVRTCKPAATSQHINMPSSVRLLHQHKLNQHFCQQGYVVH